MTQKITPMVRSKKTKDIADIDIYRAWCKGCGICAAFCPTGAVAMDETGRPYVKDAGACVNCGWCELRCPDFAITVRKKAKAGKKPERENEKEGKEGTAPPGK